MCVRDVWTRRCGCTGVCTCAWCGRVGALCVCRANIVKQECLRATVRADAVRVSCAYAPFTAGSRCAEAGVGEAEDVGDVGWAGFYLSLTMPPW